MIAAFPKWSLFISAGLVFGAVRCDAELYFGINRKLVVGNPLAAVYSPVADVGLFANDLLVGFAILGHGETLGGVGGLVEFGGRSGKNLETVLGDGERVLKLCRQGSVLGYCRPAIGENLYFEIAGIDHRLDGEEHAGLEQLALATAAEMHDVGGIMKNLSQSMAAEIPNH